MSAAVTIDTFVDEIDLQYGISTELITLIGLEYPEVARALMHLIELCKIAGEMLLISERKETFILAKNNENRYTVDILEKRTVSVRESENERENIPENSPM